MHKGRNKPTRLGFSISVLIPSNRPQNTKSMTHFSSHMYGQAKNDQKTPSHCCLLKQKTPSHSCMLEPGVGSRWQCLVCRRFYRAAEQKANTAPKWPQFRDRVLRGTRRLSSTETIAEEETLGTLSGKERTEFDFLADAITMDFTLSMVPEGICNGVGRRGWSCLSPAAQFDPQAPQQQLNNYNLSIEATSASSGPAPPS